MDSATHKHFLEYRDRYVYFGSGKRQLTAEEFPAIHAEQLMLESLGDARNDEEEARFVELCTLLFRD